MSRNLKSYLLPVLSLIIGLAIGALLEWSHIENDVVATVNGTPIRASAFYHQLEVAAGNQVLSRMVVDQMRLQFAQQQGVYPSDDVVQAKFDKAKSQPNYTKTLAAGHETDDDIRQQILVNAAAAAPLIQGVSVTDADIQQFYQANIDPNNLHARYYRPATVQVAAIVTNSQDKANAALNALATGYSFSSVAKAYSMDKSGQQGGVLPPFQKGRIDASKFPGLESLIFNMKVGQQTGITRIGPDYAIIRCIGVAPQQTVPFSQVADECKDGAMLVKGVQANGQKVQQAELAFQKSAKIDAKWPGYEAALTPTQPQAP